MVAKLGQDGHDRGAKIIASAFGDLGFEVIVGPLFQMPDEAAELAIASNVHVVGVSSLAAGHKTLLPQLVDALKERGAGNVIVICGGVVPRQDYQLLLDRGVAPAMLQVALLGLLCVDVIIRRWEVVSGARAALISTSEGSEGPGARAHEPAAGWRSSRS
jgi:methylmalonyl-CoA mutase cobalamin-binding domain/chain